MKRLWGTIKIIVYATGAAVLALVLFLITIAIINREPPGVLMTRAEYGERWPLTVSSGRVECVGYGSVVFHADGKTYAVNGLASGAHRWLDIAPIWRDNPDDPYDIGLKIDISPIISRGLDLCGAH